MAHVIIGRVVLGSPSGVGVTAAVVAATATGATPEDTLITNTTSKSDGTFIVVFNYGNVYTLSIRVSLASGELVEQRQLESPGDRQDTFEDLGEFVVSNALGGVDLGRLGTSSPARPRLSGRVVDAGGECSLHCLQVLIEAATKDGEAFRAIAVARTDRSGRFFADYPKLKLTAARALIPGIPQPIPLPTTEDGLIEADALIVVDVKLAEHEHASAGCDCGTTTSIPRLPGQEQLATASDTYSSDLGPGCITFNTPNRTIEEFDFWTVVRTSQPMVRRTSLATPAGELVVRGEPIEAPVQWDNDPALFQSANVAHGHLLHFRQTWHADGYSLGDLLYSLPLAPGQKKSISIVEWQRSETAGRLEDTRFSESVDGDLRRNRDVTEVISAALSEQSRGGSTSSTFGVGAGTGGAGNGSYQGFNFGALFGVSGGYSRADSTAWQDSARNLSSTSMNSLRDRVLQSASAIRSVRSTVVSTVGQSESVRAETETIANHNHCHALTIQYFEVLRHFQMRHELVEVKECLFVPLPMIPFDNQKILRWRDNIAPYLLRADLSGSIEALRRVENNWSDAPTPSARFADEEVVEITGELEIEFQAYPPPLPDPASPPAAGVAAEQLATSIIASMLFPPLAIALPASIANAAGSAVAELKVQPTEQARYQKFHSDYMPRFAVRFANELALVLEHTDGSRAYVPSDFTLVSKYVADRRLVVAFRADVPSTKRSTLAALSIESKNGIPDAVRCLVRSIRSDYATPTFSHAFASASRLNNDLDGPHLVFSGTFPAITFRLDTSTADPIRIRTPLDSWERRSPRDEDRRLAGRLIDHLNANSEYYHHAIWWTMDPNRRYLLLDGFLAPNADGRSISQVVENKLIGIVGNALVMPVAPGIHLDPLVRLAAPASTRGPVEDAAVSTDPTGLLAYYAPPTPVPPARISLPTKGVFAEAVMGACNACERVDDSRFWRWEQSPLDETPAIEPSSTASRRTDPESVTPTSYPTPIVSIQTAPTAPEPTNMSNVYELLGRELFRDMAGLAGTQANAAAAYKQNLDAALAFGKEASELAKQAGMLNAKDKAFSSIDAAEESNKISSDEAHALRLSALKKIVGDSGSDEAVEAAQKRLSVVDAAGKNGTVDETKARELSGTILEDLTRPRDPERGAAARKIAELAPGSVNRIEVTREGQTTRVDGNTLGQGIIQPVSSDIGDAVFWSELLTFRIPQPLKAKLATRNIAVQLLSAGYGDVNLDNYTVRITKFPIVQGEQLEANTFLRYVRTHFSDFIETDNSNFVPLDGQIDLPQWISADPIGVVFDIRINTASILGLPPFGPFIDHALVACTSHSDSHWMFSACRGATAAGHPISGNRRWSLVQRKGSWVFATTGADRATSALDWSANAVDLVWRGADALWQSLQAKVAAFVNDHQGAAEIEATVSRRYDWRRVQDILNLPTEI